MVRRYRDINIAVKTNDLSQPVEFNWRRRYYRVCEVVGTWVERDSWWVESGQPEQRIFWRVEAQLKTRVEKRGCAQLGTYDLSVADSGVHWVMERVWD